MPKLSLYAFNRIMVLYRLKGWTYLRRYLANGYVLNGWVSDWKRSDDRSLCTMCSNPRENVYTAHDSVGFEFIVVFNLIIRM
jgi:hypothetical protein